jgi:SAM-dependent methyltransferase
MCKMDSPERCYDDLAAVYDGLTADHDYDSWTATLQRLAEQHGLRGRRLLDLACGTGKSFLPFLERGFEVTACDISGGMLDHARHKAAGRVRLLRADMRQLPDLGTYDLVTCLDDAVNYLAGPAELTATFHGVAASLAPGGVFVFDANTLGVYQTLFAHDTCFESNGTFFALRGQATPTLDAGQPAPMTIEAFWPDRSGLWQRVTSHHQQRHHTDAMLRDALAAAGLGCLAACGMTPDGALHPQPSESAHTKRLYVASLAIPTTRKEVTDAAYREAGHADRPGHRIHQGQLTGRRTAPASMAPGPEAASR